MAKRTEYKCTCGQSFPDGRQRQGHVMYWNQHEPGKHGRYDPLVYQEGHEPTQLDETIREAITSPPTVPMAVADTLLEPPAPAVPSNGHSDLALEELKATLEAMRVELDALKQRVGVAPMAASVVAETKIDQEAANLAQLGAMLGIDQPSPLDKKEQAIVAAVQERTQAVQSQVRREAVEEKQGGLARGWYLIFAAVAVIAIIVLVLTQM